MSVLLSWHEKVLSHPRESNKLMRGIVVVF